MESYNVTPFVSSFFHWHIFKFVHIVANICISLFFVVGYYFIVVIYLILFIHLQLVDIRVFSIVGLLWIMSLWIFMYKFCMDVCFQFYRNVIARFHGNFVTINYCTFFHSHQYIWEFCFSTFLLTRDIFCSFCFLSFFLSFLVPLALLSVVFILMLL
jgi:hypothetical protein